MGLIAGLVGVVNPLAGGAMAVVGKAKAAVSRAPWWVWLILGGAILSFVGGCVHQHDVKKFGDERFAAGRKAADADWQKAFDKMHQVAKAWKEQTDEKNIQLTQKIREAADASMRADAAGYDNLRLHGSGKASCSGHVDHPGVAAGAGGHQSTSGGSGTPAAGLPPEDWAAVPWGWLLGVGQQCDANRTEVLAWRAQHDQLVEAAKNLNPPR